MKYLIAFLLLSSTAFADPAQDLMTSIRRGMPDAPPQALSEAEILARQVRAREFYRIHEGLAPQTQETFPRDFSPGVPVENLNR